VEGVSDEAGPPVPHIWRDVRALFYFISLHRKMQASWPEFRAEQNA
jgi:hypothetical protein